MDLITITLHDLLPLFWTILIGLCFIRIWPVINRLIDKYYRGE